VPQSPFPRLSIYFAIYDHPVTFCEEEEEEEEEEELHSGISYFVVVVALTFGGMILRAMPAVA
jgi:hypothetical protein